MPVRTRLLQEATALSRFRIFFAFAALIALATAFAACGGSGGGSSENPQTVVNRATFKGIESGNLDLSLSVKAKGKEGGNLDLSLSGPFQGEGKEKLPQLNLTAKANGSIKGKNVNFDGGLVLLSNSAYVSYQGTQYEVDPTTFGFVKQAIKQAQQQATGKGKAGGTSACQEAAGKLKVAEFVENLNNEGSADVGGTGTTKVSGDLNLSGAVDTFVKLAEGPACSSQLGAASPLSSISKLAKAKSAIKSAVKTAHVVLYVGGDNILRRVTAQLLIEPPKGSGKGPESVELNLDVSLSGVNEKQTIEAPKGAKPLNDLFLKLGVNPAELLGSGKGAGGLGSLLEGLGGSSSSSGGGGTAGGGATTGAPPVSGGQQAYLKCIQGAKTPVDLQKCATLLK
jgi:hypothetical protein